MYNILVVDDERIHREGIIMLLEKICPDDMLWEASNGQEAMEIMNNISCEIESVIYVWLRWTAYSCRRK